MSHVSVNLNQASVLRLVSFLRAIHGVLHLETRCVRPFSHVLALIQTGLPRFSEGDEKTHHGDMSKPNERGRVSQLAGKRCVFAGSINEPGLVGLMNPSSSRIVTTVPRVSMS